ncbi:MAG: 30S ribosomal protein S4 [Actinobacteria bacterium]|nr:MAG: 30S ribosomal protein S4 [Actinomycetota bacterium]
MARYTESVCKLCRRENLKLFLKGEKCLTEKCPEEKRPYAPGEHGRRRRGKESQYALQLREKQKAKRLYGVLEKQFRGYYQEASRRKGITGENLLQLLEARLDNIIYRLGYGASRAASRQLIRHGHVLVNNRKVNIPSFLVKENDVVAINPKSSASQAIKVFVKSPNRAEVPSWIRADDKNLKSTIIHIPEREEIQVPLQEQLIVELYSK